MVVYFAERSNSGGGFVIAIIIFTVTGQFSFKKLIAEKLLLVFLF